MAIVTIVCVVMALPEGFVLLGTIAAWILLGAIIVGLLMFIQAPLYCLLSGVKQKKKNE